MKKYKCPRCGEKHLEEYEYRAMWRAIVEEARERGYLSRVDYMEEDRKWLK